MDVKSLYNKAIDDLWNDNLNNLTEGLGKEIALRGYAVETELPHDDVLFVGMNPAFDIKKDTPGVNFYNVADRRNDYFKAIVDFSENTLEYSNPSHHDLLFVRHTTQKEVLNLFNEPSYKAFLGKQLDISAGIIRALAPKLIVVLNAGARSLFESRFEADKDCEYDETIGAYRFIINESTPVLFASMLSGQRPLDKGSRRSLQWHIRHILNKIEKGH